MTMTIVPPKAADMFSEEDSEDEDPLELFETNSDLDSDSDSESDDEEETEEPPPTTVVTIAINNKKTGRTELFRVLLDSGTNRCIATLKALKRAGIKTKQSKTHNYKTAAGKFTTAQQAKIKNHRILELNSKRQLGRLKVQVTDGDLCIYDFVFGRDYMHRYGIDLRFSEGVIEWDGMRMSMKHPKDLQPNEPLKDPEKEEGDSIDWLESQCECHLYSLDMEIKFESWHMQAREIKDAKYEKQDPLRVTQDQKHLTQDQRNKLHALLTKYQELFEGTLGTWPDEEVTVELTADAKPYHCGKPIRIPHAHIATLKKEVDRLVEIGVLEKVDDNSKAGPWCAPSFIIPKKDGRVRFITDYRELNKCIKRKPWPMPHIADLIQDIGKYKHVTAIDLSMGYYHFRLSDELSDMSTFMSPWGNCKCKCSQMGLSISPDFFQERMSKLFCDLPCMKVYLDDLLMFSNGSYKDHLKKIEVALE